MRFADARAMANRRWGWGMGSLLLAAGIAAACSEQEPLPGSIIGSGGDAGARAAGAGAGAGGEAEAGAAGAHAVPGSSCDLRSACDESYARFLDCPKSLAEYVPDCSIGVDIARYGSSCGGAIVVASDGIQTERWTFTPSGELVGTTWNGDVAGDHACWGEPCEPVGASTTLCEAGAGPDAGGLGGGGAGGVGGAGGAGGAP